MHFTVDALAELRPYAYHLIHRENLDRIRSTGVLESAASLLKAANREQALAEKRPDSALIHIGDTPVRLTDQASLHAGNIQFEGGWDFADVIRMLNGLVFFWAGVLPGPIDHGQRHFRSHSSEQPFILRVLLSPLCDANDEPLFCKYNSGSPRCSRGKKSPRGPKTFLPARECDFGRSKVVEIAFRDRVVLPEVVKYSISPTGPWVPLGAHSPLKPGQNRGNP